MKKPQPPKNILFFSLLFILISTNVFAQSNTCGSATELFSGATCTTTSGTTTGSTNVALPHDCTPGTSGTRNDVWYKFVALQSNLTVTLTKTDGGGGQRRTQVFRGSCASLINVACSGDNDVLGLTGLTINDTYFIRIYSSNNTAFDFNICIVNPPANDNCANARVLTPATTCTTGTSQLTGQTLENAGPTAGISATCGNNASTDVWYQFTAQSTRPTISVSNLGTGWSSNYRIALFSRTGPCTGLAEVRCISNAALTPTTDLITGDVYYIRIYRNATGATFGNTWGFDICIVDAPANDLCTNAPTITSSTSCNTTSGTLTNATYTGGGGVPGTSPCNGTTADVWYKFVATSTRPVITVTKTDAGGGSRRSELYQGSCGALTSLTCSGNSNSIFSSGLTIGQTYYIRVYLGNATPYDFTICVVDPTNPNDLCANAITLSPTGVCSAIAGNFYYATPSNPVGSTCASSLYDLWYKFTLPSNPEATYAAIGIAFTSSTSSLTSGNTSVELFNTSTCPVDNTSLGCTAIDGNRNPKSFTGLTPGATYMFRVSTTVLTTANPANWGFTVCVTTFQPQSVGSGRMREVFQQTVLSPPGMLLDPWEITYGPDDNLWITESKGYKLYKMNPSTGVKTTVLDLSQASTYYSSPADQAFYCQFNNGSGAQGGFAGMALHPKFLDPVSPQNYVYINYVHSTTSGTTFTNRVVRFTYDPGTERLESPVSLCDTIPGSNDHNSQRLIIAPVGSEYYLFCAAGDMGAGQFGNTNRPNKAQLTSSYEGKILRFNLESDGEGGLDQWIPNDNPYSGSLGVQSAVWAMGIRNNQGFAYDSVHDRLYGTSHGPFSDDELNIIEREKNYGHPLVIGYSWDGNVNGTTAGAAPGMSPAHPSSCPLIIDEAANAAAIGSSYKDPLFSAYPNSTLFPSINALWNTLPATPGNGSWPSEGWSGLGLYTHTLIPAWKQSLIAASLKWGRLVKFKLNNDGDAILPTDGADTVSYFGSVNRFRDMAFAPNGKDIYVIMDRSTSTSGPSALFPVIPACPGCVQKYTFIGYADNAGKSSIPDAIAVTQGTTNLISNVGTTITIDASNSNYWVPITGPDGNVMAEIYANGQNLGTVTSSFYQHSGPIRIKGAVHYLDRSITINPSIAPTGPVKVRFYISKSEYDALDADMASALSAPNQLKIFKNSDVNGSVMTAPTTSFFPHTIELRGTSSDAYVLQSDTISSFSTFYFAAAAMSLPVELISFTGNLQDDNTVLLKWQTSNEVNTSHFVVERSVDGKRFSPIGTVQANGNGVAVANYSYIDADAANQSSAKLYYRLKMMDADAKYTYSEIVTITMPYVTGRVAVYPNPFASDLTVSIGAPKDGRIQWKLIDNNGRTLLRRTEVVKRGNNIISINVNKLSAGFYYLSIEGAGIDRKVKLQKQ